MPKVISEGELRALVEIVRQSPSGLVAREIQERLAEPLATRTLQRRLKGLVEKGRIRAEGKGKGTRYFPMVEAVARLREDERPAYGKEPMNLSDESLAIRERVTAPLMARTPVGYDADFLNGYVPNKTAYLPSDLREDLARVGQVGLSDLPAGTYLRQVLDRLLVDLSWNSSRLEGNTYSLLETEVLLRVGEGAEGKRAEETQMILNHQAAIELLADQADEIGFNRYTICNLHALLSDNLLSSQAAGGRVRDRAVGISGTVYHPLEVPQQIEQSFLRILEMAEAITDPFEQAFFIMVHLPYLQPFEDVNKRVSRLAANIPMVKGNLCPLSFIDVPQQDYVTGLIGVYELNRVDYLRDLFVWAYRRSAARYSAALQSLGDPDPFRLRHRTRIGELVREVVTGGMGRTQAVRWIKEKAGEVIETEERDRFLEVVETELMSLHEGNIARFRLRPGEFGTWQQDW